MKHVKLTPAHKNIVGASLKRNSKAILEQAQLTYRDFFAEYGAAPGQKGGLLEMADLTSATSGVLNKTYGGRAVWAQLNQQSQIYNALPKVDVKRVGYGWRAKTAFASTGRGGTSEGTIPGAVVSTYFEVAPTIVEHATQMRVSGMQQDLAEGQDDAYGAFADIVAELAVEHAKEFERALTLDVDTLAGTSISSLDNLTASSTNQATIGWTAGDEDFAGIDKSAQTAWADPYQLVNATAVSFSLNDVDKMLRTQRSRGGVPSAFFTGWDTWAGWAQLVEPRGRFDVGVAPAARGKVNGADIPDGLVYSAFISDYQGVPIVPSDQAHADANEASRLYLLDFSNPEGENKPRSGIDVLRPTQMFLAGERSTGSPQSINFIGDSALAVTRHQLGARNLRIQAQLRDFTVVS